MPTSRNSADEQGHQLALALGRLQHATEAATASLQEASRDARADAVAITETHATLEGVAARLSDLAQMVRDGPSGETLVDRISNLVRDMAVVNSEIREVRHDLRNLAVQAVGFSTLLTKVSEMDQQLEQVVETTADYAETKRSANHFLQGVGWVVLILFNVAMGVFTVWGAVK